MRLTVCLEGNTEGRVLASVDMEEIVKMTITDDIDKSNFNPQMFKSCTDSAYDCGYELGRADKYKEIISEYMLLTEKQVEEIRADAIDDCIKLVGGNIKTIVGVVFDNSIPIHDRALGRMAKNKLIEELLEQLEQLKEQK